MSTTTTTDRPTVRRDAEPPAALSSLEALRLVTVREMVERGRTKSFIVSALVTLLLLGAAIVIPQLLSNGDVTWRIGTLGDGSDSILRVAEASGREDHDGDGEFAVEVTPFGDEGAAREALADGDVELVLVDGQRILRQGSGGFGGSDAERAVQQAAAIAQLEEQLEGTGTSVDDVAGALASTPLPVSTIEGDVSPEVEQARSLIAYGGMLLLYLAILSYGNWTLMGIAEEKASRVVEVLLATVKPWQLLAGKIIGIGLLGLAQFVLTVVWSLLLIRVTGALELPAIPLDSAASLILWFTLGYAIYSVGFATAGALVSRMEDAQSAAFPVSMIAVVGFLVSFQVLDNPGGGFGQIATHIPFISPFVVPIRVAYGEITWWEQAVSAGISMVTIAVMVAIAARVYSGGVLHFGSRMKLRQAWRDADR
ncbi:ABC transporter permease [soil metagenome]